MDDSEQQVPVGIFLSSPDGFESEVHAGGLFGGFPRPSLSEKIRSINKSHLLASGEERKCPMRAVPLPRLRQPEHFRLRHLASGVFPGEGSRADYSVWSGPHIAWRWAYIIGPKRAHRPTWPWRPAFKDGAGVLPLVCAGAGCHKLARDRSYPGYPAGTRTFFVKRVNWI